MSATADPDFLKQCTAISSHFDEKAKQLLADFFKYCDDYILSVKNKDIYSQSNEDQTEVSNTCEEAFLLLMELTNLTNLLNSTIFSFYCF